MQESIRIVSESPIMKISNFGDLQMRYRTMPLAIRASAVMVDGQQAFSIVRRILASIGKNPKLPAAVKALRNNVMVTSRIRPSEAKTALMDDSVDFIKIAGNKLESWQHILQNIASGKAHASIIKDNSQTGMAISGPSGYLAIVKLIIPELAKIDNDRADSYNTMLAEMRRATTILSDCECASDFNIVVIH